MSDVCRRPQLSVTKNLKYQNAYTLSIQNEYSKFVYDGESAYSMRGQWRKLLEMEEPCAIDLEIGTGNGLHFAHRSERFPGRGIIGIEMKYKPLVQSIRRALKSGAKNARMVRLHAFNVDSLFASGEVNDIFIHFPDPWVSPRKPKNRLFNPQLLNIFWEIQRPGSFLEFKTDSREYFDWSLLNIKNTRYEVSQLSYNFHFDFPNQETVLTAFERIFLQKNLPINYLLLHRK